MNRMVKPVVLPYLRARRWPLVGNNPFKGGGYTFVNAEAAALVARFTTPPDNTRKGLIDTFIGSLKSAGVWSKLDALYLFAAHDAQAARRNWIADSYNAVAVASPAFTVDRGYAGDGSSSYLDTGFNPVSVPSKFALNSACLGAWIRSNIASGSSVAAAFDGSNGMTLAPRDASDRITARINGNLLLSTETVSTSAGLTSVSREAASTVKIYRNGTQIAAPSNTAVALPNFAFRFGSVTAGSFVPHQFASGFFGGGLSAVEIAAMNSALNTYLTAVGAA